jgi:hypothetical protein
MTDKELLQLAAIAAGTPAGTSIASGGLLMSNDLYWNPLTNDGDALRLAVKLSLRTDCLRAEGYDKTTASQCYAGNVIVNVGIDEGCGGDPYAATRLAITRAAAELGKL